MRISLRERDLNHNKFSAQQVFDRIRAARVDISAGLISLAGQDVILRVVSTYETTGVLENLEIAGGASSARVLLKDIADVAIVEKDRTTITRFAGAETGYNAREGVLLEVLKEGDANIVQVPSACGSHFMANHAMSKSGNSEARIAPPGHRTRKLRAVHSAPDSAAGGGRSGAGRGGRGAAGAARLGQVVADSRWGRAPDRPDARRIWCSRAVGSKLLH